MRAFESQFHYVASNGSSGYAYDQESLDRTLKVYAEKGYDVVVYEFKGVMRVDNEDS